MTPFIVMLLASAPVQVGAVASAPPAPRMRKARDPDVAVEQELCAARQAQTVAAYDLFIARHPLHPRTEIARHERDVIARLRQKTTPQRRQP